MTQSLPTTAKRRSRWLIPRFSLRTLLVVLTVACLVSGFWLNRAIRQRTAVRRFYMLTENRMPEGLTTMGYRYRGEDKFYKPILPKWLHPLRDLIGEEAFGEVAGVQLSDTPTTDDDLRLLAYVPTVERLWLDQTKVTDEGLRHLHVCPKLKFLQLNGNPITDEGVARLTTLTDLESLSLSGTHITDAGLEHLAKLPRLKELWLRSTPITDEGYRELQTALPDCRIQADVLSHYQRQHQMEWGDLGF